MRFVETLRRFLYGRYAMQGVDRLTKLLAIVGIALSVVNLILGSLALYVIQSVLIFWLIARLLSKNIAARRAENQELIKFEQKFKSSALVFKRRIVERKTHIYKTCPNCKAKLRFSRIKGVHNARCPKCKKNFTVKVR